MTGFGISCSSSGQVIKINLESNGLIGTPPSSLFKLTSLNELNLSQNQIHFYFEGIEQATSLVTLKLAGTNLNSIGGISRAANLVELHLTDNDLEGDFPVELLTLSNLRLLYMNYNALEGRIPAGISSLRNLEELFLFS